MSRRIAVILVLALLPVSMGFVHLLHTHDGDGSNHDAAHCQLCLLRTIIATAIVVSLPLFCVNLDWLADALIAPTARVVVFERPPFITPRAPPLP